MVTNFIKQNQLRGQTSLLQSGGLASHVVGRAGETGLIQPPRQLRVEGLVMKDLLYPLGPQDVE